MNGSISQIIAITSFGNNAIEENLNIPFLSQNSTAQFCNKISFTDTNFFLNNLSKTLSLYLNVNKHLEKQIAANFQNWIDFLKRKKIKKLFLHHTPTKNTKIFSDRMTAGLVGGGGQWLIETWNGDSSDFWEARWEVTKDINSGDKNIWSVTYVRISRNSATRKDEHSGLENISSNLKKAVTACQSFSEVHKLDFWKKSFDNALACLNTGNSNFETIYHKDIIPESKYSEEARRILFACQSAWVFGAMGSWNDMGFEGDEQTRYEKISDNLYSEVCKAISHATNEYGK